jgi:ATP-binding cassette subfamily B protein
MVGHRTRLAQERAARRDGAEDDAALHGLPARSRGYDQAGAADCWPVRRRVDRAVALALLAPPLRGGHQRGGGAGHQPGRHPAGAPRLGGLASWPVEPGRAPASPGNRWRPVPRRCAGRLAYRAAGVHRCRRAPPPDAPLVDARDLRFATAAKGPVLRTGWTCASTPGERCCCRARPAAASPPWQRCSWACAVRSPACCCCRGWTAHAGRSQWHRLATEAPQFHENHLLSGSVAFNLLMGRQWPASAAAL